MNGSANARLTTSASPGGYMATSSVTSCCSSTVRRAELDVTEASDRGLDPFLKIGAFTSCACWHAATMAVHAIASSLDGFIDLPSESRRSNDCGMKYR